MLSETIVSLNRIKIFTQKIIHFLWIKEIFFKVVDPRKLDLRQKKIILLSRIAILLLKGYFGREKINFYNEIWNAEK